MTRSPAVLLERSRRGMLLDLTVFAVNLLAMPLLMRLFGDLFRQAAADDPAAMATLFAFGVALLVLAPTGAVLMRWHYHQHRHSKEDPLEDGAAGCLFNPIFYFCLTAVIFAAVNAYVL